MKIWTDREGNKLDWKQFSSRLKDGISMITPLQQTKVNINGYVVVLVGIVWGMIASLIFKQYWLLIILIGSFIISGMQFLGMIQKYILLKNIERRVSENEKTN